jgi:CRISPR/Cas system-associated exonuclease Cas4 (RecB family)
MKAFTRVSASQISTYLSCQRQWWWNKVFGLPTTQKPSAALGEAVHASIEAYLENGGTLHPVAVPARKKLDELRALSPLVEAKMERPLRNGLLFIGRIDLMVPDKALIVDHKTTSNLQYAKTEEELQADVQMLAYAYEVHARTGAPEITVAHNVLLTRGTGHRYTEATISEQTVLEGWRQIEAVTDQMMQTAKTEEPDAVPPTWSSCDKYGGCDFREQCRSLKLAAKKSPYDDVAVTSPSHTPMEVNMSTKHNASILRAMGLDDATILAAIRRGTCTDDVGLTGAAPAPAPAAPVAAAINPPEAPASPRVEKAAPAPVVVAVGKSPEEALRDQMKYLLSLGWGQEDIDMLSDDAFQEAVRKGYKRDDVVTVLGLGLVQGAEYEDIIIAFEPKVAPAKRPTRAPVTVTPATAPSEEKVRQPRNAVPRLKALGYPADVAESMDAMEMKRVLDGEIRYAAEETPAPVVVEEKPAPAPVVVAPAPVVAAPVAPAPVAQAASGLYLYVDCMPEKGVEYTDLTDILTPYMRKVEAAEKVPHYGLVQYNNGEKMVVGFLLADLAKFKAGHVTVDSRLPVAVRALEVLRPMAAVVISGRR